MPRSKKQTPEGAVLSACLDYLSLAGVYHWRNNTGALPVAGTRRLVRFGKVGSSDILGVLPGGRALALEVKAPGGRVSEAQAVFLADVERNGGLALVVRSLDELRAGLRAAGYAVP